MTAETTQSELCLTWQEPSVVGVPARLMVLAEQSARP